MMGKVLQVLKVKKVLQEKNKYTCYTCNTCNTSSAFTVVEMLLYMSLLTIFILVLVELFTTILKSQIKNQLVTSSAQDSRFIMQRMFYDFNNSTNLDTTIATYSTNNSNLYLNNERLNSPDTTISNLSFTKIDNSVQIKFDMNNMNYQTTFNLR